MPPARFLWAAVYPVYRLAVASATDPVTVTDMVMEMGRSCHDLHTDPNYLRARDTHSTHAIPIPNYPPPTDIAVDITAKKF